MPPRHSLILIPAALLTACGNGAPETAAANVNVSSDAERLAAATDTSWINLSGTVLSTTPGSFMLDFGSGEVLVEMDDWDFYREGAALAVGDPVVVTGKVDDDLWQNRKIEASSVYAKNLDTYFYASGADEEELAVSTVYVTSAPSYSDSTGYVTAVEGREFTLGSVNGAVRVDTAAMAENPLDDDGFQQIQVGDRVYVWGDLDLSAREAGELMAKGIVTLRKDASATS